MGLFDILGTKSVAFSPCVRCMTVAANRERRLPMSSPELHDIHLLGRVATGDREAFTELFDRHSPLVLGVLVRMLHRRDEAEDALQEAFLQAWKQAPSFDPERASARGWLLMLARSRALDRLRSERSRDRREEAVAAETATASIEPTGTSQLEEEERQGEISSALDGLSTSQRECIELAYFEGLTHSQVAERLGQPLGTVKSRILLGMGKLRLAMGG